jgi:hypothetical protein
MIFNLHAPYFSAGLVLKDDMVAVADTAVCYMEGWTIKRVIDYCHSQRWACEFVRTTIIPE